jgi:hypothetical protein
LFFFIVENSETFLEKITTPIHRQESDACPVRDPGFLEQRRNGPQNPAAAGWLLVEIVEEAGKPSAKQKQWQLLVHDLVHFHISTQNISCYPSDRIFGHMHGALNIGKKDN